MSNEDIKLTPKEWYVKKFRESESSLNGQTGSALHRIRRDAAEKLAGLDFPTPRLEEWKYTNTAPVMKYNFIPVIDGNNAAEIQIDHETAKLVVKLKANLAVFVNGHYSDKLSQIKDKGIRIEGLASVIKKEPELVLNYFTKFAAVENGFSALNTAFASDGAFIFVPKNFIAENPVYLLFLSGNENELILSQPRNLIVTDENSQATIIEDYRSISNNIHLTNVVSEFVLGENSAVDYYRIQEENANSFHISKTQAEQARNSNFTSNIITTGSSLLRNDLNSVLNGEGCECTYYGLYITGGLQHIDNHTLMDHAKPHCQSNELYKGILSGKSRGVFNGKVMVRKDAQKTNAYQSNKNIILSNEALVNTKPQLEIFADDVRCTHGATVGQLNDEEVFYLRSRGIDDKDARQMLIHAFANDVIELIKPEPLREYVNGMVSERLDEISSRRDAENAEK